MARYPSGATVTVSTTITDRTGAPADASVITLTVHQPDGTVKTYLSPTHDGVGLYHQDLPTADTTPVGMYPYTWTATVASTTGISVGNFDVYDPFEPATLALQDAKDALNIPQTVTSSDAEVARMVSAVQALIERMIGGPIITREIANERVRAGTGYRTLTVRYRPLVSVVSIADTSNGVALSLTDLDVDYTTGVIRRKLQLPFWSWGPYYLVTYTAGLGTAVPPAVEEAAAIILQDLWRTQRGGAATVVTFGGTTEAGVPPTQYAIPPNATELLSPYLLEAYL